MVNTVSLYSVHSVTSYNMVNTVSLYGEHDVTSCMVNTVSLYGKHSVTIVYGVHNVAINIHGVTK